MVSGTVFLSEGTEHFPRIDGCPGQGAEFGLENFLRNPGVRKGTKKQFLTPIFAPDTDIRL